MAAASSSGDVGVGRVEQGSRTSGLVEDLPRGRQRGAVVLHAIVELGERRRSESSAAAGLVGVVEAGLERGPAEGRLGLVEGLARGLEGRGVAHDRA